ncbi:hypothetical protein [Luteitalea sp.]
MINQSDHPVSWTLMLYELDEVREHLESLVHQMSANGRIDEDDFRVHIGHAYFHLNRVWNGRNEGSAEVRPEDHDRLRQFPVDVEPVG